MHDFGHFGLGLSFEKEAVFVVAVFVYEYIGKQCIAGIFIPDDMLKTLVFDGDFFWVQGPLSLNPGLFKKNWYNMISFLSLQPRVRQRYETRELQRQLLAAPQQQQESYRGNATTDLQQQQQPGTPSRRQPDGSLGKMSGSPSPLPGTPVLLWSPSLDLDSLSAAGEPCTPEAEVSSFSVSLLIPAQENEEHLRMSEQSLARKFFLDQIMRKKNATQILFFFFFFFFFFLDRESS